MHKISSYKIAWNTKANEGTILVETPDGVEQLLLDSAEEGKNMLQALRNESHIYIKDGVLFTGFKPIDMDGNAHVDKNALKRKVESYRIAWNTKANEGTIIVQTEDGVAQLLLDSAEEGKNMLDLLRREATIYVQHGLLFTGFDEVGEGEPEQIAVKTETVAVATVAEKAVVKKKKTAKKEATPKTSRTAKDKLRLIEGIGPKIEGLLQEGGILTFQDLADAKQGTLKEILAAAGPRYRMHDPGTWGEQAALAAEGKMKELKKWQDELKGGRKKKD